MITTINEFRAINEIGEGTKSYNYTIEPSPFGGYSGFFITERNEEYEIYMTHTYTQDGEKTNISFDLKGYDHEADKETNTHDQYRIMTTIILVVKDVLKREPGINIIEFEAKEKKIGSTNQRLMLYLAYAKKHLGPEWQILKGVNSATIIKGKPGLEYTKSIDSLNDESTNESLSFPAAHGINQEVAVVDIDGNLQYSGRVSKVSFTAQKVFYDVVSDYDGTIECDIDSVFVERSIGIISETEMEEMFGKEKTEEILTRKNESRASNLQSTNLTYKSVERNDILWLTVMLKPRNSAPGNRMGEMGVVKVRVLDTFYGMDKLKHLKATDKIM